MKGFRGFWINLFVNKRKFLIFSIKYCNWKLNFFLLKKQKQTKNSTMDQT